MRDNFEPEYTLSKDNLAHLAYVDDKMIAKSMGYKQLIKPECMENGHKQWIMNIWYIY